MGYFANGTEGDAYQAEYCDRCANQEADGGCAIWDLHLIHNYDECNNSDSPLHFLIPRSKDGLGNEQCRMFRLRDADAIHESEFDPTGGRAEGGA